MSPVFDMMHIKFILPYDCPIYFCCSSQAVCKGADSPKKQLDYNYQHRLPDTGEVGWNTMGYTITQGTHFEIS